MVRLLWFDSKLSTRVCKHCFCDILPGLELYPFIILLNFMITLVVIDKKRCLLILNDKSSNINTLKKKKKHISRPKDYLLMLNSKHFYSFFKHIQKLCIKWAFSFNNWSKTRVLFVDSVGWLPTHYHKNDSSRSLD